MPDSSVQAPVERSRNATAVDRHRHPRDAARAQREPSREPSVRAQLEWSVYSRAEDSRWYARDAAEAQAIVDGLRRSDPPCFDGEVQSRAVAGDARQPWS